jgi:hypothetical protein
MSVKSENLKILEEVAAVIVKLKNLLETSPDSLPII